MLNNLMTPLIGLKQIDVFKCICLKVKTLEVEIKNLY